MRHRFNDDSIELGALWWQSGDIDLLEKLDFE